MRRKLLASIVIMVFGMGMAEAAEPKPWFSLSTYKTFSPDENAQVHLSYRDIDAIDFRVYRVRDPILFFEQLEELHAFGPSSRPPRKKGRIEALHTAKQNTFLRIKKYIHSQLSLNTRKTVLQSLGLKETKRKETPKVVNYAQAPILNQSQLAQSWHASLPQQQERESYWKPLEVPINLPEKGVYLVEAVNGERRAFTVLIISNLTLVTKSASGHMLVAAVDRHSGRPMENCNLKLYANRKPLSAGKTDSNGFYALQQEDVSDILALASSGSDFAVSDLQQYYFRDSDQLKAYVYTDRPVYRPGHKVYFKGILREVSGGQYTMSLPKTVAVEVRDAEGKPIYKEALKISEYGTFDGELTTTEAASLGVYSISCRIGEQEGRGSFRVEEYKKPEYQVKVAANKKYYVEGETIVAEISARYYFGEPVMGAKVQYQVYKSRYYNWGPEDEEGDYYAGEGEGEGEDGGDIVPHDNQQLSEAEGALDANGKLTVRMATEPGDKAYDFNYRIVARVTDAARREISGSATVLVTRGEFAIGLTPDKYVYQAQDTARIAIRTATFEGRPVAVPLEWELNRVKWVNRNREEQTIERGAAQTDSEGKGVFSLPIRQEGYYHIKATARDVSGHIITTAYSLYVSGAAFDEFYGQSSRQIELIPDRKSYRVGDVAHVLVLFPMNDLHAITAVEGRQMHDYRMLKIAGRSAIVDVPIRSEYALNCFVNIAFVKGGQLYTRSKFLNVSMDDRYLEVTVTPDKDEYKPQERGDLNIVVKDSKGVPVRAELSVGLVDESIYGVRPDNTPDIRKSFYSPSRYNRVYTQFSAAYHFTGYSTRAAMLLAESKPQPAFLADFKPGRKMAEAKVRKLFPDTLFWNAHLVTNGSGRARISVQYPDSLTTWRATVRAVTRDTKVGGAVGKTITRKNLILRLHTPRFFTERDEVVVSTIIHNYLTSEKTARVSLEVKGAELIDGGEKTVAMAARGEARIDWRVKASTIGEVTLLGRGLTDEESDAVEIRLPTIPYGLEVMAARSGHSTKNEDTMVDQITIPTNAGDRSRSLRIDLSPSLAATIVGALDYLTSYPYGCVEQTMSSFLPNVIMTKTLQELKLHELKSAGDLPVKVRKGLDRLYSFQHSDGGWGWWENDETHPFMTAYVVAGLNEARQAGYSVDEQTIRRGRQSLEQQLKNADAKKIDPDVRSYMVYALATSGGAGAERLEALYQERNALNNYGLALLALALGNQDKTRAATVVEELEKKATVRDFDAHWESKRQAMLDFSEDNTLEATSFAVKALSWYKPQSAVMGKAVRWLVGHRRFGYYWDSTKHTAIAIDGLIQYIKTTQELDPDYRVKVYLNGTLLKEQSMTAREAQNSDAIVIPVSSDRLRSGANEIKIVKSGRGSLYYALSAKYYTAEEKIPAQGTGLLSVERSYFKLRPERQRDRITYKEEPLDGPVVSGDTILVRLKINGGNLQYMMIEDPIPAGCEPVAQDAMYELSNKRRGGGYYDFRELRDQKVVFFKTYFGRGREEFTYILKAQIPGSYRVMPTRAELMYQPDVRANSENHTIQVHDK